MVLPVLDYGDFIIDGAHKDSNKLFETIQNHFLRCCMGVTDNQAMSRILLRKNCLCTKLSTRRDRSMLALMYSHVQHEENIMELRRTLRSNCKIQLIVQRPRGALYRRSPLFRGRALWDELDCELQHEPCKIVFLEKLCKLKE